MTEQMKPEHYERLHSAVVAMDMQLEDIGKNDPEIFGQALLSMLTFMVEKVYLCSANMEAANALLAAAQEAGLETWVNLEEARKANGKDESVIVTLDDVRKDG